MVQLENKVKILIIHSGGTIGMKESREGLVTEKGYLKSCIQSIDEIVSGRLFTIEIVEQETLDDSSELSLEKVHGIFELIRENYLSYDGFIILHGTDTMAYCASLLSFMLVGINKPVVLTGAQLPIWHLRSDARVNVTSSCILIAQRKLKGILLCFNGDILQGNRSTKLSSEEFKAFACPNANTLGHFGVKVKFNHIPLHLDSLRVEEKENFKKLEAKGIKTIVINPLESFEDIEVTKQTDAIVFLSYGVGSLPSSKSGLANLLKQCAEKDTLVVVLTQCQTGGVTESIYESQSLYEEYGILSGGKMTYEACLAKILFVLNETEDISKQRELWAREICGEHY